MAVRKIKHGVVSVGAALAALKAAWAGRDEPRTDSGGSLAVFLRARAADCRRAAESYRREAEAFEDMVRRVEAGK